MSGTSLKLGAEQISIFIFYIYFTSSAFNIFFSECKVLFVWPLLINVYGLQIFCGMSI